MLYAVLERGDTDLAQILRNSSLNFKLISTGLKRTMDVVLYKNTTVLKCKICKLKNYSIALFFLI